MSRTAYEIRPRIGVELQNALTITHEIHLHNCSKSLSALFGSAARGEMRPDSDIDLLVEFLPSADVA
jgi:predicted nucleotidyltransferase